MKKIFLIMCFVIFSDLAKANAEFYEREKKECPVLFELGEWGYKKTKLGEEYWGRDQNWIDGNWKIHRGGVIELEKKHKSYSIKNNLKNPAVLVYIGPWQKVTLTKGLLWNKEITETEIRMIASQRGKYLESHYEIKDEENSKIPEQNFAPLEEPDDLIVKCDILRAQKWEYDAILEGHINILRAYIGKSPFATSGKMINAYTKEVLADFGDQIKK